MKKVVEKIKRNKTSTPGPDGLPFAAWKCVADFVGPFFFEVIKELMKGDAPMPSWFNAANLFLLPKKVNSVLPKDTRPISITNTGNRIIASIFKDSCDGPLSHWFLGCQKGFVKGRVIDTNVKFFSRRFYKDMENKKEGYFLLADFSKAFDSISHKFIFAVMKKIGVPRWFSNAIRNLLKGVTSSLSLGGASPLRILIQRGVKQGCPLSPILFTGGLRMTRGATSVIPWCWLTLRVLWNRSPVPQVSKSTRVKLTSSPPSMTGGISSKLLPAPFGPMSRSQTGLNTLE